MPTPTIGAYTAVRADHVVAHTLLNCYVREVADEQARIAEDHLCLRLPSVDQRLRVEVRRRSMAGAHRFTGPVSRWQGGEWSELDWREVADVIAAELTLATGMTNDEFAAQVAGSHDVTETALCQGFSVATDRYLASEQALLLGHRFHPTPKARSAPTGQWQDYAPETGSRFPLRHLAVRADLIREAAVPGSDLGAVDRLRSVPPGYRLLPVHPWQYDLLRHNETLTVALRDGAVLDLGTGGPEFTPTSSVRTLHGQDCFLKFSLNVRITNCVRKNAAYELASAVALTTLLDTELADLPVRFPGCRVLREPGYRTLDLGDRELFEGFGVILRDGLSGYLRPGVTPLLAAAVADEYPLSAAHVSHLAGDHPLDWWRAYLRLLLPPVLAAFFDHGVVLEPHLQNVLVGVNGDGMPVQMLFRDMEGTKLLAEHHAGTLAALSPDVAGPLTYPVEQGWQRVAYCLLVNHVAELVAALADLWPALEPDLWAMVRDELAGCRGRHGLPPELRAILAGAPVPAKANLLARWQRANDRRAGYVPLTLPLGEPR
ncbi:MAG TPA: IucA/IucC family protein [Pseudonocardiaceae bacterium]|nr:IucA/IucC family protein [Pseudonocardiaceae bacterium]